MLITTKISNKLEGVRDYLLAQYISSNNIKIGTATERYTLAMNCIVQVLNRAHCAGNKETKIVLKREFFSSIIINGRKQRKRVSYTAFRNIIEWLCDEYGCVLVIGGGSVPESFSSNLRASSVLHLSDYIFNLFTPIIDNKYAELDDVLKLKDKQKKLITFPTTHKTKYIVSSMYNYNTLANNTEVTVGGERRYLQVARVFNNSTFNNGGRIYTEGGNVQCEKLKDIGKILINGNNTSELDFKSLHPSLLADKKGISFNGHDPYMIELEGYTIDISRELGKAGVMCSINCKSKSGAISALTNYINNNSKLNWKLLFDNGDVVDTKVPSAKIINQVVKHNPMLEDQWFKGKGVELQAVDSEIAMLVLNHFTEKGVLLIPKHDSFIFESCYIEEVDLVMKQSYLSVVGSAMNCRVEEK